MLYGTCDYDKGIAVVYGVDRTGSLIVADDSVESDCNIISFVNHGDTPVTIKTAGGTIKRVLNQDEEVSFGSDNPALIEKNRFEIEFSALVSTRELGVERTTYRPL